MKVGVCSFVKLVFVVCLCSTTIWAQCSKQDYQRCVKLADPLLRDPHLIYPDNLPDVELVCRTWTVFVDCVKNYTDRCFTDARRKEFNEAVETPVSSIHQLCSMPEFRKDYLKHASCMKMALTQDNRCGRHYRLLVALVSDESPPASVCCSHHMLRECVVDQTKNSCEPDSAPFSASMLDKALSFLTRKCSNFRANQRDCPGVDFYKTTARSETRLAEPEATAAHTRPSFVGTTRTTSSRFLTKTYTTAATSPAFETPKSSPSARTDTEMTPVWSPTIKTSTEAEEARTSFGRGMTWKTSSSSSPNQPTYSTNSWRVTSSDIWMPSSRPPPMIDNAIDEPNQQGLGSQNSSSSTLSSYCLLMFSLIVTTTFLFTAR